MKRRELIERAEAGEVIGDGSKQIAALVESIEFTRQWYATRWERLRDLVKDTDIEKDACCIMANGVQFFVIGRIMGMSLTTYVGPYLTVPRGFEWWKFDNIIADGRGEAGVGEDVMVLVPNQKLKGVERSMRVDRTGEQEMCQINPAMIVKETAAFVRLAEPVFKYCDDYDIEIYEGWGVVPCWS